MTMVSLSIHQFQYSWKSWMTGNFILLFLAGLLAFA